MASFSDLTTSDGLKELDEYLLTRSYIDGWVRAPCSPCADSSALILPSQSCNGDIFL